MRDGTGYRPVVHLINSYDFRVYPLPAHSLKKPPIAMKIKANQIHDLAPKLGAVKIVK